MVSLSDRQLQIVMQAARTLPTDKRDVFLQRVAVQLELRRQSNDAEVDTAARAALGRGWYSSPASRSERMSAIGSKADMACLHCTCPLMTQSGHATNHQSTMGDITSAGLPYVADPPEVHPAKSYGLRDVRCSQ